MADSSEEASEETLLSDLEEIFSLGSSSSCSVQRTGIVINHLRCSSQNFRELGGSAPELSLLLRREDVHSGRRRRINVISRSSSRRHLQTLAQECSENLRQTMCRPRQC